MASLTNSTCRIIGAAFLLLAAHFITPSTAAEFDHSAEHKPASSIQEGGQSAFAAIQEIVSNLMNDPHTQWSKVDIEALRQHLIDMDNVTIRATVSVEPTPNGALFVVSSDDLSVRASIKRMVTAHVATMNGKNGWSLEARQSALGAQMSVSGKQKHDAEIIRGLGFIGIMTVGAHHQAHHQTIANGANPHHQN